MTKLVSSLFAASLIGASFSAIAMDNMQHERAVMKDGKSMSMGMKAMDADGDGMISKDEFLKYQEQMYDGMQKNKDGMVDMKTIPMMHHSAMKSHSMMKSHTAAHADATMKNGAMTERDTMMKGDSMAKGDGMMKSGTTTKDGISTGQKSPN